MGDATQFVGFGLADSGERLRMSFTSYSGCFGSFDLYGASTVECSRSVPLFRQADGCLSDAGPIRFASIGDGLSNTFMVAEKSTTRNRTLDRVDPLIHSRFGWYFTGFWGDTLMTTFYPPNSYDRVSAAAADVHTRAASSLHPGGFHGLMADGSARFITNGIDTWEFDRVTGAPLGAVRNPGGWWSNLPRPGVWQALGTRNAGELVPLD